MINIFNTKNKKDGNIGEINIFFFQEIFFNYLEKMQISLGE